VLQLWQGTFSYFVDIATAVNGGGALRYTFFVGSTKCIGPPGSSSYFSCLGLLCHCFRSMQRTSSRVVTLHEIVRILDWKVKIDW
jgi:hypothetical protein